LAREIAVHLENSTLQALIPVLHRRIWLIAIPGCWKRTYSRSRGHLESSYPDKVLKQKQKERKKQEKRKKRKDSLRSLRKTALNLIKSRNIVNSDKINIGSLYETTGFFFRRMNELSLVQVPI